MNWHLEKRTIAAIATPLGEGAVAMIRLSGIEAFSIANKIFSKSIEGLAPNTVTFGKILGKHQETLDEVMIAKFCAPKSFTGEDTIEIYCHGGLLIQKNILNRVIEAGAFCALPGEFSYQAFMNGKIDLAQAEAIQEIVSAKNEYALKAAEDQLQGALSKKILTFRQRLVENAAIIDAWVDYPEEGLEFKTKEELLFDLEDTYRLIEKLKETFYEGRKISHGIKLCLLGAPNAGKSSLMNAILGYDRAIVTPIAGTTRDVLQEDLLLFGMHFKLIDTAGIRKTEEIVEKEGIRRSFLESEKSDLTLYVIDSSEPLTEQEKETILSLVKDKTLLLYNKSDLNPHFEPFSSHDFVKVSAKTLQGLDHLKNSIEKKIFSSQTIAKEEVLLTKERHYEALNECLINLKNVIEGLNQDISSEFISFDLRMALKALGSIIGFDLSESILDSIFSKFCVGK
jgi:tRNA modification GTPase